MYIDCSVIFLYRMSLSIDWIGFDASTHLKMIHVGGKNLLQITLVHLLWMLPKQLFFATFHSSQELINVSIFFICTVRRIERLSLLAPATKASTAVVENMPSGRTISGKSQSIEFSHRNC